SGLRMMFGGLESRVGLIRSRDARVQLGGSIQTTCRVRLRSQQRRVRNERRGSGLELVTPVERDENLAERRERPVPAHAAWGVREKLVGKCRGLSRTTEPERDEHRVAEGDALVLGIL